MSMKPKKLNKFEELKAIDTTLMLLEFWAWRAEESGNAQQAQSFERGYAVFEEQKQTLVWALTPDELLKHRSMQKTVKAKPIAIAKPMMKKQGPAIKTVLKKVVKKPTKKTAKK